MTFTGVLLTVAFHSSHRLAPLPSGRGPFPLPLHGRLLVGDPTLHLLKQAGLEHRLLERLSAASIWWPRSRSVRLGRRARALDRLEAVRPLKARVGERVGVVPLDPHQPRRSPALLRDPHHGPASLEQGVTPNHVVPNAELNQ